MALKLGRHSRDKYYIIYYKPVTSNLLSKNESQKPRPGPAAFGQSPALHGHGALNHGLMLLGVLVQEWPLMLKVISSPKY